MRYLLFTLIGFFGPALLMLLIRLILFRIRDQWLFKKNEPEIIDVTPVADHQSKRFFLIIWLLLSMVCTGLLIWQLDSNPAAKHTYIPAHIDADGQFVPAQTIKEKSNDK